MMDDVKKVNSCRNYTLDMKCGQPFMIPAQTLALDLCGNIDCQVA
jgi:hypothetical protein